MNKLNKVSKIVVVDDHILFREGLISIFQNTHDFVIVGGAGSVYDGILMVREVHPDIVLMDFNLPDGTGLDAAQAILAEFPEIKIIFLTIYETDENLFAAIRLGAKGFILKNISGSSLISSLRALERGEMALSREKASRVMTEFAHSPMSTEVNKAEIINKLSSREMDVLRELASGATNLEIAQKLFLSENTVKHHISNVFEKLGLENRRQAAQLALQHGLQVSMPKSVIKQIEYSKINH